MKSDYFDSGSHYDAKNTQRCLTLTLLQLMQAVLSIFKKHFPLERYILNHLCVLQALY